MNQETEKCVSRRKIKGNYFTISYKPKRHSFSNIKGIIFFKHQRNYANKISTMHRVLRFRAYNTAALAAKTPFVPKVNS